jgi:uncharacterized protein (TIGR02466 family)
MTTICINEQIMFFSSYYDGNLNDRVDPLKLEKEIGILKSALQGKTASNIGGWQSKDLRATDVSNYSEFISLIGEVTKIANKISDLWNLERSLEVGNFWININNFKDYNVPHYHPGSIFSLVYYVKVNDKSGRIVFKRPDLQEHYINTSSANQYTFKTFYFSPNEGDFVLFPSYIEHCVESNSDDESRISISFNFS